jgi:hypothetical protein
MTGGAASINKAFAKKQSIDDKIHKSMNPLFNDSDVLDLSNDLALGRSKHFSNLKTNHH